jgi:hypothetical protein
MQLRKIVNYKMLTEEIKIFKREGTLPEPIPRQWYPFELHPQSPRDVALVRRRDRQNRSRQSPG